MIAHNGAEQAERWLRGVKANLARKAAGGDRDVARDILGGICDIGMANAYNVGRMKNAAVGTDPRKWGDGMQGAAPDACPETGGTHVNISRTAVAKHAPNQANAVKFLKTQRRAAQALYARANYEDPVRANVEQDPVGQALGPLQVDFAADGRDCQTASKPASWWTKLA